MQVDEYSTPAPAPRDYESIKAERLASIPPASPLPPPDTAAPVHGVQPPSRVLRSGTAYLGRYNEAQPDTDLEGGMHARTANAMQRGKDLGLATPGVIEHATAQPGVNPYAVAAMSLSIQRGFRFKMLAILVMQLVFTTSLAAFLRWTPPVRDLLEKAFPAQSIQSFILMLVVICSLPFLSVVKERHPYNLIATLSWSTLSALFIAVSDLPGAYFRSHAIFILMIMLTSGVTLLLLFSQIQYTSYGEPVLFSFRSAGWISYFLWMPTSAVIFGTLQNAELASITVGHFVTITVGATILFAWVTYDAFKLCCKMSPDEYMKGVIYFYTDMFYMCACCCLIACAGGAGK